MPSFPFLDSITALPLPFSPKDAEAGMSSLLARMRHPENREVFPQIENILKHPKAPALLNAVFAYSPFLSKLILNNIGFFTEICRRGPETCLADVKAVLAGETPVSALILMKTLRMCKNKASLLIALADIGGVWSLEHVTEAMSEVAERCIRCTSAFLLHQGQLRGDIALSSAPEHINSGLIILAVGKLGARELNYSSDVDLILLYDRERVLYRGTQSLEHFFSRFAREMVRILQERTPDGYAFRVDLRLRPDPASTPAAISTTAALVYYETVGQNWERAALIKARPIAGDRDAGHQFLKHITPFIWRKHLDFAAIADIQSIKRQMDARTGGVIGIPGHNIKTGLGGIREIEFFTQIHQLIWGGREMPLRQSGTCATLKVLAAMSLISEDLAGRLTESYRFLRTVEHRLQMVDDQQTHTVPVDKEAREQLAGFLHFPDVHAFEQTLLHHLQFVHSTFAESFRGQGRLGGDEGKLSFTGVENDPQTLATLRKMGYENPASVSEIIQSWHHGMLRATRTQRARELITELTPELLQVLGSTAHPDQAFIRFNEFLSRLPSGVQLFSLFNVNRQLLDLIAIIMGSAPALAEHLSKNPNLFDAVLNADFYAPFPQKQILFDELAGLLAIARDFEDEMDIIRRFKNEKQFQAGVQLIRQQITAASTAAYLSDIADTCIEALLHRVEIQFSARPGFCSGRLATVALGRLGARELTFGSDIDLIFVYDGEDKYVYHKLSQRFIASVTALTKEGQLYQVDTRLRPSGHDGLLAVSGDAFDKYLRESAWTFELMALTRARVITGNPALKDTLGSMIKRNLARTRDARTLLHDITDLRAKITREFGSDNPWDLKYVHGGLMDLDFLAQYFVLVHAASHPELIGHATNEVFAALIALSLIDNAMGEFLINAHRFMTALFVMLRLCAVGILDAASAPRGLKQLLARGMDAADFSAVNAELVSTLNDVRMHWKNIVASSHIN